MTLVKLDKFKRDLDERMIEIPDQPKYKGMSWSKVAKPRVGIGLGLSRTISRTITKIFSRETLVPSR